MEIYETISFIFLGAFWGLVGQCIRVIVGLKKRFDEKARTGVEDWFDLKRLMISLLIGLVCGSLGAIYLLGEELTKDVLLTLIAMGYAGTDFIEGLMRKMLSY